MLARLLTFAVIESLASTMVQRGVFYYTTECLRFTPRQNLLLALAGGAVYVTGALSSHAVCRRTGEKAPLLATLLVQIAMLPCLTIWTAPPVLVGGLWVFMFATGMMWPIVESYISAGQAPAGTARVVGQFNLAWSLPMPVAVWLAGPVIRAAGPVLFACAAAGTLLATLLVLGVPRAPTHIPADHPERPEEARLGYLRALTSASRASMVASYAMLFILSPLLPQRLMHDLGYTVGLATFWAGFLEAGRAVAFLFMQRTTAWHDRRDILAIGAVLLPAGFLVALLGPSAGIILAGALLFGIAQGIVYYGALYYAMVVSNASVDAGGAHEGLIGSGFVFGPLAALAGQALAEAWGAPVLGMLVGVTPIVAIGAAASLWPLARATAGRKAVAVPRAEMEPQMNTDERR